MQQAMFSKILPKPTRTTFCNQKPSQHAHDGTPFWHKKESGCCKTYSKNTNPLRAEGLSGHTPYHGTSQNSHISGKRNPGNEGMWLPLKKEKGKIPLCGNTGSLSSCGSSATRG